MYDKYLLEIVVCEGAGVKFLETYGTIHLKRRRIFTIFDPYHPTIGIPAKWL